jgi:hypothetical protein
MDPPRKELRTFGSQVRRLLLSGMSLEVDEGFQDRNQPCTIRCRESTHQSDRWVFVTRCHHVRQDPAKEIRGCTGKGLGEQDEQRKARDLLAPFDLADRGCVNSGPFGKLFLRQSLRFPFGRQNRGKPFPNPTFEGELVEAGLKSALWGL